jgi:hypothetical protein
VRKLAVHYFLRFDFAFVSDLTDNIIKELNVTSFPRLVLLKYNFEGKAFETDLYEGDFSQKNYEKLKEFIGPFALK